MALTRATLGATGHQNDSLPRIHVYSTADAKTDVDAANYWAGAYVDGVRAGHWIACTCSDGGVLLYVAAISATTSTVTVLTPA